MTECARIIKEGKLPKSFFAEEKRNNYLVTREMKKIWAIELDLLLEFKRVCQKYNLEYFLIGGSLLGAVRHSGFIPWDDDIDVCMPRNDFERFLSLANEFREPYFVQTPMTDIWSGFSFVKFRNSNTTAIDESFINQEMNQGIFIDIIPIDKMRIEDADENFNKIKKLAIQNSTYMRKNNKHLTAEDKRRLRLWEGRKSEDVFNEIQQLAAQYECLETEYVGQAVVTYYDYKRMMYRKEDCDTTLNTLFEGIEVAIPCGYKNILKIAYGDKYMLFPPNEERKPTHRLILNPDVSYKDYKKYS